MAVDDVSASASWRATCSRRTACIFVSIDDNEVARLRLAAGRGVWRRELRRQFTDVSKRSAVTTNISQQRQLSWHTQRVRFVCYSRSLRTQIRLVQRIRLSAGRPYRYRYEVMRTNRASSTTVLAPRSEVRLEAQDGMNSRAWATLVTRLRDDAVRADGELVRQSLSCGRTHKRTCRSCDRRMRAYETSLQTRTSL